VRYKNTNIYSDVALRIIIDFFTAAMSNPRPGRKLKKSSPFKHRETALKKRLYKGGMFLQHRNASLRVSYAVSLMTAKQKKAHTIVEDLAFPVAKVMVRYFWDELVKNLNSIFFNTVQRKIEELSVDILQQVISEICRSENGFAN